MREVYGCISENLETAFEPFENEEKAKKRRDYYNGYEKNSRYIAIKIELDEDGEPDFCKGYDIL